MKKIILFLGAVVIFFSASSQTVSINDFKSITGTWSGVLTYLDYTSHTEETIPSTLTGKLKGTDSFELDIRFPGEKNKGGTDTYVLENMGTMISGMKVIERSVQEGGLIKVVVEVKGKDGNENKPATFNYILEMGSKKFVMTKMVKFDGEKEFFQRNQFSFTRK